MVYVDAWHFPIVLIDPSYWCLVSFVPRYVTVLLLIIMNSSWYDTFCPVRCFKFVGDLGQTLLILHKNSGIFFLSVECVPWEIRFKNANIIALINGWSTHPTTTTATPRTNDKNYVSRMATTKEKMKLKLIVTKHVTHTLNEIYHIWVCHSCKAVEKTNKSKTYRIHSRDVKLSLLRQKLWQQQFLMQWQQQQQTLLATLPHCRVKSNLAW